MRPGASLAFSAVLAAAFPAAADTVTEVIPVSGSVQNEPIFVTGSLFNPSLGTLTGVSVGVSGSFSASVFIPGPAPSQFTAELLGTLTAPNQTVSGNLGDFTLTAANPAGGGDYSGFERFNADVTLTTVADYVAGSANATSYLAEIGLDDRVISGATGASSDFSTFAYTLDVTYTYDVAEPPSLLVMGCAASVFLATATLRPNPGCRNQRKKVKVFLLLFLQKKKNLVLF